MACTTRKDQTIRQDMLLIAYTPHKGQTTGQITVRMAYAPRKGGQNTLPMTRTPHQGPTRQLQKFRFYTVKPRALLKILAKKAKMLRKDLRDQLKYSHSFPYYLWMKTHQNSNYSLHIYSIFSNTIPI